MKEKSIQFLDSCKIIFATTEKAKQLISKPDEYTNVLTKFDLQAKIKTKKDLISSKDYLTNASRFIYRWESHEINYLKKIIQHTEQKVRTLGLRFSLPEKLFLIKSSMNEEGGANGFTRQNFVVLNRHSLSMHLFEHELFHIISRFNSNLIELAFPIIGFKKCNEVVLPHELTELKISNPDAPFNNYYINIKHQGASAEAITIIYSQTEYQGGSFFSYLKKGLLFIEGAENKKVVKRDNNGKIILVDYESVDNLFNQIGRNTGYNIHPEEITADHFSMVLNQIKNLPNQNLVTELKTLIQNN